MGWSKKDGVLNVQFPDTGYTFTAPQNSDAAGTGPYNLFIDENNYFEIDFEAALISETEVKFETTTSGPRVFLFGIKALK